MVLHYLIDVLVLILFIILLSKGSHTLFFTINDLNTTAHIFKYLVETISANFQLWAHHSLTIQASPLLL